VGILSKEIARVEIKTFWDRKRGVMTTEYLTVKEIARMLRQRPRYEPSSA
jgi:hypothetical protein